VRSALVRLALTSIFLAPVPFVAQEALQPEEHEFVQNPSIRIQSYKTMFAENWLTPEQYMRQYRYVRDEMPDEFRFEKHTRSPFTAQPWTGIGPGFVKTGDPNIVWHGRVRSFRWYYNPRRSEWEPYIGACSGGLW